MFIRAHCILVPLGGVQFGTVKFSCKPCCFKMFKKNHVNFTVHPIFPDKDHFSDVRLKNITNWGEYEESSILWNITSLGLWFSDHSSSFQTHFGACVCMCMHTDLWRVFIEMKDYVHHNLGVVVGIKMCIYFQPKMLFF